MLIVFSQILGFYGHKKCRRLLEISEKVQITAKFQKIEFDKYCMPLSDLL